MLAVTTGRIGNISKKWMSYWAQDLSALVALVHSEAGDMSQVPGSALNG